METKYIDLLFLELSQFANVKTKKEINLEKSIWEERAKSVGSNGLACQHSDLYPLTTEEAIKKLNGGGNIWYCPDCGRLKHIDLDGVERWTSLPRLLAG